VKNESSFTKILKLSDTQFATQSGRTMNWSAKPRDVYPVNLFGDTDKSYTVEPGNSVTFIFEGGIVPPKDFEEDLRLAVYRPEYGLDIPAFEVYFNFDYAEVQPTKQDAAVAEAMDSCCLDPVVKAVNWHHVRTSIPTKYAEQRLRCSFDYKVTVSEDEEEQIRCCLIHLPQYYNDETMYFPHELYLRRGKRTCECCE
jgi:hypothetical protein